MTCKVCRHSELQTIDESLLEGASIRDIARQYGFSAAALHRHKKHVDAALRRARDAAEISRADTLVAQLQKLRKDAQRIQAKAETAKDYRAALQGIRELERLLELALRFSGTLVEGTHAGSASRGNSQATASISRHAARILKAFLGLSEDVIHVVSKGQAEALAAKLRDIYGLQELSGEEALRFANQGLALLDAGGADKNPHSASAIAAEASAPIL